MDQKNDGGILDPMKGLHGQAGVMIPGWLSFWQWKMASFAVMILVSHAKTAD
ncbi:hypothetical protein KR767_11895 [Luteibacter anthropi]|uniref:hypothetical protein n=1 Tax=Luteibacter anthropi TaxID=564369 RepID=UPI0020323A4C|nr:hypothetical protein [Luteibacter anthropi]URX60804.1 hypothetical protein KR767_11895 [Luteibacter anthropi]